jgi:hypothetical protein
MPTANAIQTTASQNFLFMAASLAQSNAPQRGTHIRRRNRTRLDGAVAVVRSVAVAIRALDFFS